MSLIDLLESPKDKERRDNRVYGVTVGVVTNNQDPTGGYRVKVRFPWVPGEIESFWARVATLMAGDARGTYFLPEVDDEVLVAFEHGDVNRPYVIGALWNGVDKPPRDNNDGKNNERVIRSRSGHEVILGDDTGKEKVEIRTNAGHSILLDDTSGSEKILVKDKGGSTVEIDSNGQSVTVKAGVKVSVEAAQIEVKASGQMKLSSGGVLEISGALVKIN